MGRRLMGAYEIRTRLGVSRQRVEQLMKRPDWPEPYETLATGRVWRTEDIESWIREYRPHLDEQE
ncbi:AlpA family transcriptional regulator [Micromonospora sp. RP3T]|uniref:helix-turn-helix transcriptional regulator n=1 Tax=Micromonospora sp. RP3T TaxID=2135446 RepID=UPI001E5B58AA|nr:DNA-binding protein [Micromonospora sp. RP3T]